MNDNELLHAYRKLWSNRTLSVGSDEKKTLEEAIKKELFDEMTHPRVRKSPDKKLLDALKRIIAADISPEEKLELISKHMEMYEKILTK